MSKFKDIRLITVICVAIGIIIFLFNYTFFKENSYIFGVINIIIGLIALGIPIMLKYNKYKQTKEIEAIFPKFLADINENINAGMTLPQAIKSTKNTNYGSLTPYVTKMINKLEWGINFEQILENFAKEVDSPVIRRTVRTINEAHRSGGTIGTVLESVSSAVQEIERIKKERSASIYSQMINGYFIFFIFLGVMFGLSEFLIPSFQFEGSVANMGSLFKEIFRNMVIIQGFFAGLAIGKMAEGSFIEGLKHSLILVILGYSIYAVIM